MFDESFMRLLVPGLKILTLIFAFIGMYFHSFLAPAAVLLWLITLGFVFNYFKLPSVDPTISKRVIFAEWKTGGSRAPVVGHGGGSFDAPDNTLESFREAAKNGADAVEFDVHMTKDNIGVLIHDQSVERTTDGSGIVSELTYEEIQKLDASAKHSHRDKFKGAKVPTLEQGIQECLKLDLLMVFDVKSVDLKTRSLILEMFKKYKLHRKAIVSSFNPFFLYKVKAADADVITVQLMRPYLTSYNGILADAKPKVHSTFQLYGAILLDVVLEWSINNWLCHLTGVSAVSLHHQYLSPYIVDSWRSTGLEVMTWTVNDKAVKEFWKLYNVPVITDSFK